MKTLEKRYNPFIYKCITQIAKMSNITYDIAKLIFEISVNIWRDPYHTIEYLLIKSIDSRLSRMVIKKGDSILNVGCGYPINEIIFSSWGAKNVVGIDIDNSVIKEGQKILDKLGIKNVKLYTINALEIDQYFPIRSFDVVTSFSAIEHLNNMKNYEKWIKKMSDLSKRAIVLTTSNRKNWLIYSLNKLFHTYDEYFFDPEQVKRLLLKQGLKIIHFETNTLICYEYIPLPFKLKYNIYTLGLTLFLEHMQRNFFKNYGGRMGFVAKKIS